MKIAIDFIVLILIYIFIFYRKWKTKGTDTLLVNTTMYIYLSFVLYFTLMPVITALPFIFNHSYVPMNLVPFIDVLEGRGDFARQVGLNVIMTIPFGFLFSTDEKRKGKIYKSPSVYLSFEFVDRAFAAADQWGKIVRYNGFNYKFNWRNHRLWHILAV